MSVVAERTKVKASTIITPMKVKAVKVMIKKLVSTNGGKIKREEAQSSKGPGPNFKTTKSSKEFGIFIKGTGPSVKSATSKGKGKSLSREERQ